MRRVGVAADHAGQRPRGTAERVRQTAWPQSPRLRTIDDIMPAPSPPTRAPRRTRAEQAAFYEHLVGTALRLFADEGFEALSMRRLAGEVGVPPMTLYRYFPSKSHLVRHVWDHILVQAQGRAVDALAGIDAPLARLRAYLDGFMQYWLEQRAHYWIVFATRDDLGEWQADETAYSRGPDLQCFLVRLDELFDACIEPTLLAPGDRQRLIDLVLCKVLGLLHGTIGLSSLRWVDVDGLSARCSTTCSRR